MRRILYELSYLARPRWDTGISPPELIAYIGSHLPGTAVELGCGTGTNLVALARSGWRATGVEFSKIAIHAARRRLQHAGLAARLLAADVTKPLHFAEEFDLALDIGCYHTLAERGQYLDNLAQLLPVGGNWLVYGFLLAPEAHGAMGLTVKDIETIPSWGFRLLERSDGLDHGRPSAWLLFERVQNPRPEHARAAGTA